MESRKSVVCLVVLVASLIYGASHSNAASVCQDSWETLKRAVPRTTSWPEKEKLVTSFLNSDCANEIAVSEDGSSFTEPFRVSLDLRFEGDSGFFDVQKGFRFNRNPVSYIERTISGAVELVGLRSIIGASPYVSGFQILARNRSLGASYSGNSKFLYTGSTVHYIYASSNYSANYQLVRNPPRVLRYTDEGRLPHKKEYAHGSHSIPDHSIALSSFCAALLEGSHNSNLAETILAGSSSLNFVDDVEKIAVSALAVVLNGTDTPENNLRDLCLGKVPNTADIPSAFSKDSHLISHGCCSGSVFDELKSQAELNLSDLGFAGNPNEWRRWIGLRGSGQLTTSEILLLLSRETEKMIASPNLRDELSSKYRKLSSMRDSGLTELYIQERRENISEAANHFPDEYVLQVLGIFYSSAKAFLMFQESSGSVYATTNGGLESDASDSDLRKATFLFETYSQSNKRENLKEVVVAIPVDDRLDWKTLRSLVDHLINDNNETFRVNFGGRPDIDITEFRLSLGLLDIERFSLTSASTEKFPPDIQPKY